MTEESYTDDEDVSHLEQRIDELEATIRKMLPGRRDAMKLGGAAVIGAAAMSGTASAGSSQVGTIGSAGNLVDVEAEDIEASDTITTQDLVVNGTATGPFGGGGVVLESGDTITVEHIANNSTNGSFVTLYNGSAKDVLGGVVGTAGEKIDFLYTFSDGSTLRKNGPGTSFSGDHRSLFQDDGTDKQEVDILPPAKDVTKIEVGANSAGSFGAEVILKD